MSRLYGRKHRNQPQPSAPHPPERLRRLSISDVCKFVCLMQVALTPLLFWRSTAEAFEFPKQLFLRTVVIALLALGLWIVGRLSPQSLRALLRSQGRQLARDPLCWGVLAFWLSALASTLGSVSPLTSVRGLFESHNGLITISEYAVLFFAARAVLRGPDGFRLVSTWASAAAIVAAAYALVQAAGADPVAWSLDSRVGSYMRPFGTLGHPNTLGAYLAMALPLLAARWHDMVHQRRWLTAGCWTVGGVMCSAAVVMTLSRAAWLASGVAGAVLVTGWFIVHRTARRVFLLKVVGVAGLAVLAAGTWSLTDGLGGALRERLYRLGNAPSRTYLWQAGWEMFRDHPVLGTGLDTFQLVFPRYRQLEYWQIEWNATPARAHNDFIHVLATQGTCGGAAMLLLIFGLIRGVSRQWNQPGGNGIDLAALTASVIAFGVQGLFGFTVAATGSLFVTLVAWLSAEEGGRNVEQTTLKRVGGARKILWKASIGFAAASVTFAWVAQPFRASVACQSGDEVFRSSPAQAVTHYGAAVMLDEKDARYWVKLGTAQEAVAGYESSAEAKAVLLTQARRAFERSVMLVPASAYYHANLARALGELAMLGRAREEGCFEQFTLALALDPWNAYFYQDAGRAALLLGNCSRAKQYWERGFELYPRFAPFRAELGCLAVQQGQETTGTQMLWDTVHADWFGEEASRHAMLACLFELLFKQNRLWKAGHVLDELRARAPDDDRLDALAQRLRERLVQRARELGRTLPPGLLDPYHRPRS